MKKRKNRIFIIVVYLLIIGVNHIVISSHNNDNFDEKMQIAKPIINIEKDEQIKTQIYENMLPVEYNFSVNNYISNSVNEVEFEYRIKIDVSDTSFPVGYKLFDCENNEFIELTNGKSEVFILRRNKKESRKFKLYFEWRELTGNLADEVQIDLKIDAVQSKGEIL